MDFTKLTAIAMCPYKGRHTPDSPRLFRLVDFCMISLPSGIPFGAVERTKNDLIEIRVQI